MIPKLKSAISTIHATVLAVREVPDALRYVVEFARENGTHEEIRRVKKEAVTQAHAIDELVTILVDELDVERFVNNEQWGWAKERIELLQSQLTEEHRLFCQAYDGMRKWELWAAGKLELINGRPLFPPDIFNNICKFVESLQSKLARYEAAEKWHQVTRGEGELPPEGVKVFFRNTPRTSWQFGQPDPLYWTYEWRFASGEDVPQ